MGTKDKWMWVPMLALMIGGGLPALFVDFAEDSWQERIWVGMSTAMLVFIYFFFKWLGTKFPAIAKWAQDSVTGVTILVFASAFLVSGLSAVFALMPFPHWLHLTLAICLALVALSLVVKATNAPSAR